MTCFFTVQVFAQHNLFTHWNDTASFENDVYLPLVDKAQRASGDIAPHCRTLNSVRCSPSLHRNVQIIVLSMLKAFSRVTVTRCPPFFPKLDVKWRKYVFLRWVFFRISSSPGFPGIFFFESRGDPAKKKSELSAHQMPVLADLRTGFPAGIIASRSLLGVHAIDNLAGARPEFTGQRTR